MIGKLIHLIKNYPLLMVSNLFGIYLFGKMAEDVVEKEFVIVIDRWISMHISMLQTPLLNHFMVAVTSLNNISGNVLITSFAVVFLIIKKWYKDLWFFLLSVGGAAWAFIIIKYLVHRARPEPELVHVAGYAFPSGHTTLAMAMAGAFYFIFQERIKSKSICMLLMFGCFLWPMMVGISRVYLDVHWLSDVIAGWGLGLFWVTFLALFLKTE